MCMENVRVELKGKHELRFKALKRYYGLTVNAEVIRLALKLAYDVLKEQLSEKSESQENKGEVVH